MLVSCFFTTVAMLTLVQWILRALNLRGRGRVAMGYYAFLCRLLRIRVQVRGTPVTDRPVLMISNHTSWADILAIGSVVPVAFVAKREVRTWPVVGIVAELQRTVFVDRQRRQQTGEAIADMVARLSAQVPVVLFAEGTSNDGNRVLPFRSALMGAVRDACNDPALQGVLAVQPMSIAYTGMNGFPLGRQHRPITAWYGDLDLMPHLSSLIRRGPVEAVITFGEPMAAGAGLDRKQMTRELERRVRRLTAETLRGREAIAPTA